MAAAPLDVSLALNGDVRLGPDGPKLSVTLHREGWNGTAYGVKGDWSFPDPKTGTAVFAPFSGMISHVLPFSTRQTAAPPSPPPSSRCVTRPPSRSSSRLR